MTPLTQRFRLNATPALLSQAALALEFYRGIPLAVEVAVFDSAGIASLSGVTSLTMMVKATREGTDAAALMSQTIASFTSCTAPQWIAGSNEHAVFEFDSAECNLDLSGAAKAHFWLVFKALLSSGEEVILGTGNATCYEANATAVGDPPENPAPALGAAEADARFVRFDGAQTLTTEQQDQVKANLDIEAGGVTDHGALSGLGDDDHTQYHTDSRGDARYPLASAVTAALAGKASSTHTHAQSDITGLVSALAGKASTTHTHAITDTTGLQAALDAKEALQTTASQAEAEAGTSTAKRSWTPERIKQAIQALTAGGGGSALVRGSGTLTGYTDPPVSPTSPDTLTYAMVYDTAEFTVTVTVDGVDYIFSGSASDPADGSTWIDTSSGTWTGADIASAVATAINAASISGISAAPITFYLNVTHSGTGTASTLAGSATGIIGVTILGGGAGTDGASATGQIDEVIVIAQSGTKKIKPVRLIVSGDGLGVAVQIALKISGVYYPLANNVASGEVYAEPLIGSYISEWLEPGRASGTLVARYTGDPPAGGSLNCIALVEQI